MKLKLISILAALCALSGGVARANSSHTVTVDPQAIVSTDFLGFGINWCPYPWYDLSDEAWAECFRRLDYQRPTIARVMVRAFHYCEGFDAAGNPVYTWDSPRMQRLYRLLDYCQRRGITVIFGEWESPRDNGEKADQAIDTLQRYGMAENDSRWHRMIADGLEHLITTKGYTCIKYYNLVNEPNGSWSGIADFPRWSTALKSLHALFQQRGLLEKVSFVGPDAAQLEDSYWLDLSVRRRASEIALYDLHHYAKISEVEAGVLEPLYRAKRIFIDRFDPQGRKKPFLIGEAGMERTGPGEPQGGRDSQFKIYEPIYGIWMADYSIQCVRAGLQGVLMWSLDDAEHLMNDDTGWPDVKKSLFKKWGFWNGLGAEIGHPEDMNLRPWYYSWSLMSRYLPAGSRIVKSSELPLPGVRTLAATIGEKDLTVVLVNNSDVAQELKVVAPQWTGSGPLKWFDYSEATRPADQHGFPVPARTIDAAALHAGTGLTVLLPARSLVLLTSRPD